MTPQTPRAALSDADIDAIYAEHSGSYAGSGTCVCEWVDSTAFARAILAAADRRLTAESTGPCKDCDVVGGCPEYCKCVPVTAEQGGAASDRKLFEALSKYIHCVLQELQFERGTGSLAAHNLRLCLIEVDKALRGERDSAMNVGVGFPLEGVVADLTTQPQAEPLRLKYVAAIEALHGHQTLNNQEYPRAWHEGVDAALAAMDEADGTTAPTEPT